LHCASFAIMWPDMTMPPEGGIAYNINNSAD